MAAQTRILLIPAQRPQQELQAMDQILASQGFDPSKQDPQSAKWSFTNAEKTTEITIRLMAELGIFRLALQGAEADTVRQVLGGYLPSIPPDTIRAQITQAGTTMEKQLFTIILMLSFVDGASAMDSVGQMVLDSGPDELRMGVVQGLMMLEAPDVGPYLDQIAIDYPGEIGTLADKAAAMLADRGLLHEPVAKRIERALEKIDSEPQATLAALEQLAESEQPSNLLHTALALTLRTLGRAEDATQMLETIADGPDAPAAFEERALSWELLGENDRAMADARQALAGDPDRAAAQQVIGRLELATVEDEDADAHLQRLSSAIEGAPDDIGLRIQRAASYVNQGALARRSGDDDAARSAFDAALADVEHAATLDKNDPRMLIQRARAELGAGRLASALRSATRAAAKPPEKLKAEAIVLPGVALLAFGEPERARASFRSVTSRQPEVETAWLGLGIAHELLGNTDEAGTAYQRVSNPATARDGLDPIVYAALPVWNQAAAQAPIRVLAAPERKTGTEPIDSLFKVCLDCGTKAMGRRTQCRECGGRDFLRG